MVNLETIWHEFLKIIKEEAGSRVVETWFKAVVFSRWDSYTKSVYLNVPNTFVKDWISSNYHGLLQIHLGRLLNETKLNIIFLDETKSGSDIQIKPAQVPQSFNIEKVADTSRKLAIINSTTINDQYLFDSFVVGPHNALAYAAAHAVTEKPGLLYNPLFIYGGSGLGKTHLIHAIANKIRQFRPNAKILYQTSDRFVSDFIQAIRFNKVGAFESKYRDLDVLLIDDIQFISNKEQTQESFFHIFNLLYDSKKQIVLSSDSMPRDIAGLAERLRSRLDGGLIADIQIPTLETMIAILKKKAELHGVVLSDDVAFFIASNVKSNVRELEGILVRVMAYSNLIKQDITVELVRQILLKTIQESISCGGNVDFEHIVNCVNEHYGVSLADLRSTKRQQNITMARHVVMYLAKKLTKKSLAEIAYFLLRKDHSTVVHAIDKINCLRAADNNFSVALQKIEHSILK